MLCAIAKLPAEAVNRLQAVRDAAAPNVRADRSLYGHITLATYLSSEEADFIEGCRELLRGAHAFSVHYVAIEALPATSILVATPEKSGELLRLHDGIAARFGGALDTWTRGGDWRPHTTLLCRPGDDLTRAVRRARRVFAPFEARITRVEFSRVDGGGYTILDSVKLAD